MKGQSARARALSENEEHMRTIHGKIAKKKAKGKRSTSSLGPVGEGHAAGGNPAAFAQRTASGKHMRSKTTSMAQEASKTGSGKHFNVRPRMLSGDIPDHVDGTAALAMHPLGRSRSEGAPSDEVFMPPAGGAGDERSGAMRSASPCTNQPTLAARQAQAPSLTLEEKAVELKDAAAGILTARIRRSGPGGAASTSDGRGLPSIGLQLKAYEGDGHGLLVTSVVPGTDASRSNLVAGMRILTVNGHSEMHVVAKELRSAPDVVIRADCIDLKGVSSEREEYEQEGESIYASNALMAATKQKVYTSIYETTHGATDAEIKLYERVVDTHDTAKLYDEVGMVDPLAALSTQPEVSVSAAVEAILIHCGEDLVPESSITCRTQLERALKQAEAFATYKCGAASKARSALPDTLTYADITVINLYTKPTELYRRLNAALGGYDGAADYANVGHFMPFLKLLVTAMHKLPRAEIRVYVHERLSVHETRCGAAVPARAADPSTLLRVPWQPMHAGYIVLTA